MIIDEEQKLKIWEQKPKNRKQKLTNWRQQINAIQAEIEQSPKKERAQCGRKCIAKTYVQSFFPGLEEAERESKVAEIIIFPLVIIFFSIIIFVSFTCSAQL